MVFQAVSDLRNKNEVEVFSSEEFTETLKELRQGAAVLSILEKPPKKSRALWIIRYYYPKKELSQPSLL